MHVDDLATACVHVLEKWNPDDIDAPRTKENEKLYYLNVGSGEEISIKNLADKIAFYTKFKGEIIWDNNKPDGTYRKNLDLRRIKSIGWEPKINLEEGLKKLIVDIDNYLNKKNNNYELFKNFF